MYECPQCGDRFQLVVEKKADVAVTLTVVHDHADSTPLWRATAVAKGERRGEESKDILAKNLEMKKSARISAADKKRDQKNAEHPLPWAIPEETKRRLAEAKRGKRPQTERHGL